MNAWIQALMILCITFISFIWIMAKYNSKQNKK